MKQMPILVINLPQCVDRKQTMEIQLKKLGLPYNFIEAVDGKALTTEEKDALCDYKRINKRYHTMLSDGEIGCSLSHKKVYDYMIKNNISKAIILEDDVILKDNFIDCYNELLKFNKNRFLVKLNSAEAEGKKFSLFGSVYLNNFLLKKEAYNCWTSYSYYIDIQAADMILKKHPKIDSLADDFFNYLAKNVKTRICFPKCTEVNTNFVSLIENERTDFYSIKNQQNYSSLALFLIKKIRVIKYYIKLCSGIFNPFN